MRSLYNKLIEEVCVKLGWSYNKLIDIRYGNCSESNTVYKWAARLQVPAKWDERIFEVLLSILSKTQRTLRSFTVFDPRRDLEIKRNSLAYLDYMTSLPKIESSKNNSRSATFATAQYNLYNK